MEAGDLASDGGDVIRSLRGHAEGARALGGYEACGSGPGI